MRSGRSVSTGRSVFGPAFAAADFSETGPDAGFFTGAATTGAATTGKASVAEGGGGTAMGSADGASTTGGVGGKTEGEVACAAETAARAVAVDAIDPSDRSAALPRRAAHRLPPARRMAAAMPTLVRRRRRGATPASTVRGSCSCVAIAIGLGIEDVGGLSSLAGSAFTGSAFTGSALAGRGGGTTKGGLDTSGSSTVGVSSVRGTNQSEGTSATASGAGRDATRAATGGGSDVRIGE